ncbi:sensor histidine kinase [Solidesulfovibrio sp.]
MAGSATLGLRAAGVCVAVTALALGVSELVPAAAGTTRRLAAHAGALTLAGAVFWFFTRRLSRSLAEVIDVARAIGGGDYRRRLHLSPGGEFAELAEAVNHMARGIEANISTITDQKTQLQAILDGMREAVLVLDASGRVRSANPALAGIATISGPAQGRRPIEVIPSPELQMACDRLLADEEPAEGTGAETLEAQLGPGRFYEVSLVRLGSFGPAEVEPGVVLVFHDVSETRRLSRVRRDFAANVTHELRTPLTSIKGYAETVLGAAPELAAEKRRFLEVILKNANHMSKMVDDILNLARLEEGQAPAPDARADAAAALADAIRECEPQAQARELVLDCRLPENGPALVCDGSQLTQVWRNLIENAIRFSPERSRIVMTAVPDPDRGVATCSVLDQGPGIAPEERQRVFERFYRVERHRSKTPGSTGLGLAIVKHIIERHGGRIWVERGRGEMTGAAFHFSLPLAAAREQAGAPVIPAAGDAGRAAATQSS